MPRRIDIELTSAQPDGTWTWRAAGARQPKGSLDGSLLPEGAKSGDVVRADADFEIDGITIMSVAAPREKKREEPERIEIIGPPQAAEPGVTTQLATRTDRRPSDRRTDRDGRPGRDRDRQRTPGRDGARPERPSSDLPRTERGGGERGRPDRSIGDRARREHGGADRSAPAGSGGPGGSGGDRTGGDRRPDRFSGGPRREGAPRDRSDNRPLPAGAAPRGDVRRRARRLNPANTHRAAVLAALVPEQQPVAEQVLRGGIPAVRTAIHLEREKATAEGRAAPNADALLAMAEELLPRLKAAEWRDRAEAAVGAVDDIALRDLRSVVAGADVAREDESRQLASTLREALERRVTGMRTEWSDEITHHLDEGRVVRALRLAGRPPEPQTRVGAELAERLSEVAGQGMAADTPPDRWAALLDAVAASPMRRTVKPAGLPREVTPELLRAAHQQSGRVPALAPMLGISIPPPPGPPRPTGAPSRPGSPPRRPPHSGAPEGPRSSVQPGPPSTLAAPETATSPETAEQTPEAPPVEPAPTVDTAPTVEPAPTAEPEPSDAAGQGAAEGVSEVTPRPETATDSPN